MRTRKSRQRGRTSSRATPVVTAALPPRPAYPRGNPLTDWVGLTDPWGTCWLAYVEPAPAETPLRRNAAVLPGRRLRFDSLAGSLVVSPIPAGSPFLSEERLQRLLAEARPVPALVPAAAPAILPVRALRSVDWAGSVAGAASAVRNGLGRQWRATADVRRLCARGLVHAVAPAVLLLVLVWEAMLVRPRARI
ncbi:MAG: hypothetical protein ACREOC_06755 [Gemmatimonadales bacterium]